MSNNEFLLKNRNSSVVQLISGEEASNELKRMDNYLRNLSKFDLESRIKSSSPTVDDYRELIAQHILNWKEQQIRCIENYIDYINTNYIDRLQLLMLPSRILVVLTNGKDENRAAYCRNNNVIVLPEIVVQAIDRSRELFLHELFHIWSRQETNEKMRNELYASIGYRKIPLDYQPQYPSSLLDMKLTNPDAPLVMEYFIILKKKDEKGDEKSYKCTPIIHALRSFDPNYSTNMFQYLVATTLVLDEETYEPKQPFEYLPYDEATNFKDQIGENTSYIIHPEEILADNFVLWLTGIQNPARLRSPIVVENMNEIIVRSAN